MDSTATKPGSISRAQLTAERPRLVRLCYRFTGSLDAAEDLAQETLYEALRNAHKLHDPSGAAKWLAAIAHNVCRRWNERRGRELARILPPGRNTDDSSDDAGDELDVADEDYDLDVELDRRELVRLLDRALDLLPAESREVLIARYVDDSPYAEIALRLGLTAPAVAKRLERGRLRLKHVLATNLIHEAVGHGLITDRLFDDWDETPIWCPSCGRRRLYGKRMPGGRLWLICQPCLIPVNLYATVGPYCNVRGHSATFLRTLVEYDHYFGSGYAGLTEHCCQCGREIPYRPTTEPWLNAMHHYLRAWCATCANGGRQFGLSFHLLATPEGRQFRQDHPRLRFLPEQEIEASGVPALVVRAESMTSRARLEGVFARDTFERIRVAMPGPLS